MASGCAWSNKEELERLALLMEDLEKDNRKLVAAYKTTATAKQWEKVKKTLECEYSFIDEDDDE